MVAPEFFDFWFQEPPYDEPPFSGGATAELLTGVSYTIVLPEALEAGTADTYSLNGILPTGMSFDAATRTISGTPTAISSGSFTLFAENSDGRDFIRFIIEVDAGEFGFESEQVDIIFKQNELIAQFVLPDAVNAVGTVTYSLTPALPTGVTLTGRVISGTPTELSAETEYTWSATDTDSNSDSLTFSISVVADLLPSFAGKSVEDQHFARGSARSSFSLPAATSGDSPITYTLSPALPTGMSRLQLGVTGVPTVTMAETEYTWTVEDADGDTAALTFNITIHREDRPTFYGQSVPDQSFMVGEDIGTIELPLNLDNAGNAPLSYTLSPALPAGLTRTGQTISGTPTETIAETEYTWTVTDARDNTDSITFDITVDPDLMPTFGSSSVNDKSYISGSTISAFTLPAATNGDAPLGYTLTPALPAGITRSGRRISGRPTGGASQTTYTWTVEDADGDTDSLTFDITVIADVQPNFSGRSVSHKSYIQNSPITAFTLPTASSGNRPISYALTPSLPAGLRLNNRTVSGTPTGTLAETTYTWIAQDVDVDIASIRFNITVVADLTPTFGSSSVTDKEYIAGSAITAFDLPAATSGNAPLSYTLTPALPSGMSRTGFTVSGTPSAAVAETTYTWTVEDVDGDTTSLTFDITVAADVQPNFTDISVADQSFRQNNAITAFTLPAANSGNAPIGYSISPALPDGLTLTGRTVSGTPTGTLAETEFTWTAEDVDGDTAALTFDITIIPEDLMPTFGTSSITDRVYRVGSQISPVFLPTATGGDGTLTHTLSPDLPAGLTLVGGTVIFGTPTEVVAETEYTWTATDADDDTASLTFDITVEADMVTSFGDEAVDDQTLIVGEAYTLTMPAVNVGDHPITYTLRPGIPPPLTLSGRTISGTPVAAFRTVTQTWTAEDEDGDTASITFDFTVEADVSPNFTDISVADQSYRQGVAIADLTLPAANSGNAPLTYALTPALPAGLTLTDGVISGTPTGSLVETEFTWTATDANDDEAELTFDITIAANLAPSFAGESVDDKAYIAGTAITAFDLPAAASGDAPVVYSLSPALPGGMSRTGFRVSGTPSAAVAETEYTWTATDADDDTDSLTFSITVAADLQPNFTGLSVDDQSLVEDIAITAFTLPDAASGNAPLSYTLTPALPAGLSLTGRTVSGTPTAALSETEYTWEVTDANDDTASLTFDITIAADVDPDFGSSSVSNKTYITGHAITAFTLPTAGGGNAPLMYALTPALPTGLSQTGRVVSGTPTGTLATTQYTWTVTDVHGDTDSIVFFLAVVADTDPSFSGLSIADRTFIQDVAITAFALPRANGGNVPVSYALTPALPAGLTLTNSVIRGTPTATASETEYTWTATDADNDTDSLTFDITVEADTQPTFGAQTVADQSFVLGTAITNLTLPAVTSGNEPIDYSISPALPMGLSISAARVLSGTPGEGLAETEFTWTATDVNGDTDTVTFDITVVIPPDLMPTFAGRMVADQSFIQNSAITSITLPAAVSGDAPVVYSLTPALPAGLSRTGFVISGTPTGAVAETEYTWTATDNDDDTDSLTFSITVAADVQPTFGAASVTDKSYIASSAITSFTLPVATSGNAPVEYALTPALPRGLSLNGRVVSGTPTLVTGETLYTWTATDADGDTDSITFNITVVTDLAPTFGSSSVADQTYRVGTTISRLRMPGANGGNTPRRFSLTPALPAGLTRSNRNINGTPTEAMAETTYTWTVTDVDGDTDSITFNITVEADLMPTFGASTVDDKTYRQGSAITAFDLPAATSGNDLVGYTLSPALPNGLSRSGFTISGTPTAAVAETEYTWTAEDDDGDTAALTFNITIEGDLMPTFGMSTVDDKSYIAGSAITAFTLPLATSGNTPVSYTLTPALPTGLSRTGRVVSGTPSAALSRTEYMWTATDSDNDAVSIAFDITVAADLTPTFGAASVTDKVYKQNTAIAGFALPAASSGNAPISYTLTPALPTGINRSVRTISGTPTGTLAETEYTWTAEDVDGDTASLTFDITVEEDLMPTFGASSVSDKSYRAGSAITSFTLPAATGGDAPLSYTLTPALPTGLSRTGRVVSGTPTGAMAETEYTWEVTDADNDTASLTFDITVATDLMPTFGGASVTDKEYIQNSAITAFTLPAVTSGDSPVRLSLTPALPTGLTLTGRRVSGTPTGTLAETEYTWTATDDDGDTASLTFDITVVADLMPNFTGSSIADQSFINGEAITAFTLPAASSGNAPLGYSITPGLPNGLTLTGRRVSGTPLVTIDETEFTWTAEDVDGDNASLTFSITIAPPLDLMPTFGSSSVTNKEYMQGRAITAFTLPAATSGDAPLRYSISPALPTGITLTGRRVSGTPTGSLAQTTYTWTVTDADDDTASLTFDITVIADTTPTFGAGTVFNKSYIAGSEISGFALPRATSGNAPLSYTLTPALPSGITRSGFDVTGTPSAAFTETEYTWTVEDADGDTDTITFDIEVVADTQPTFGAQSIAAQSYVRNVEIATLRLPVATGGNVVNRYSISPGLPAGLSIDSDRLELSGTPTASLAQTEFTWTATDFDGDTASIRFTIAVADAPANLIPTFGAASVANKTYRVGTTIPQFTLPTASSGNAPLSYTLTPALPAGINLSGRVVSGTPGRETAATTYTWTVTDADNDTDTITFSIAVEASAGPPPDPASNWRAPRTWQGKDGEEELADKLGEWDAAQSYGQKSAYNPTEDIYDLTFEWSEPLNETMPAIARSAGQIFVGVGRNRLRAMAAGNGESNYAYMSNGTDITFASLQGLIDAAFPTMRQGDLVVVGGTSGEVVAFPTPFDRNPPYILQLMNGDVYWRATDGDVHSSSRPL